MLVKEPDYYVEAVLGKGNGKAPEVERFAESCFLHVPFPHESRLAVPVEAIVNIGGEAQPPENFHLTLLVADRCSDDQLTTFMANLSPTMRFSVEVTGLAILEGFEGNVLVWKVDPGPALSRLQQELYENASNEGMFISQYSDPSSWVPHITIADKINEFIREVDLPDVKPFRLMVEGFRVGRNYDDYYEISLPRGVGDRMFVERHASPIHPGTGSGQEAHAGNGGESVAKATSKEMDQARRAGFNKIRSKRENPLWLKWENGRGGPNQNRAYIRKLGDDDFLAEIKFHKSFDEATTFAEEKLSDMDSAIEWVDEHIHDKSGLEERHYGPGQHPSGSPQEAHAGDGVDFNPRDIQAKIGGETPLPDGSAVYTYFADEFGTYHSGIITPEGDTMPPPSHIEGGSGGGDEEFIHSSKVSEARKVHANIIKWLTETSEKPWTERHEAPIHPGTGTDQSVHAGGVALMPDPDLDPPFSVSGRRQIRERLQHLTDFFLEKLEDVGESYRDETAFIRQEVQPFDILDIGSQLTLRVLITPGGKVYRVQDHDPVANRLWKLAEEAGLVPQSLEYEAVGEFMQQNTGNWHGAPKELMLMLGFTRGTIQQNVAGFETVTPTSRATKRAISNIVERVEIEAIRPEFDIDVNTVLSGIGGIDEELLKQEEAFIDYISGDRAVKAWLTRTEPEEVSEDELAKLINEEPVVSRVLKRVRRLGDGPFGLKHYGPGPHKGTGTPQAVHAGMRRKLSGEEWYQWQDQTIERLPKTMGMSVPTGMDYKPGRWLGLHSEGAGDVFRVLAAHLDSDFRDWVYIEEKLGRIEDDLASPVDRVRFLYGELTPEDNATRREMMRLWSDPPAIMPFELKLAQLLNMNVLRRNEGAIRSSIASIRRLKKPEMVERDVPSGPPGGGIGDVFQRPPESKKDPGRVGMKRKESDFRSGKPSLIDELNHTPLKIEVDTQKKALPQLKRTMSEWMGLGRRTILQMMDEEDQNDYSTGYIFGRDEEDEIVAFVMGAWAEEGDLLIAGLEKLAHDYLAEQMSNMEDMKFRPEHYQEKRFEAPYTILGHMAVKEANKGHGVQIIGEAANKAAERDAGMVVHHSPEADYFFSELGVNRAGLGDLVFWTPDQVKELAQRIEMETIAIREGEEEEKATSDQDTIETDLDIEQQSLVRRETIDEVVFGADEPTVRETEANYEIEPLSGAFTAPFDWSQLMDKGEYEADLKEEEDYITSPEDQRILADRKPTDSRFPDQREKQLEGVNRALNTMVETIFNAVGITRHGEHEGQEGEEGRRGGSQPGYTHTGAEGGGERRPSGGGAPDFLGVSGGDLDPRDPEYGNRTRRALEAAVQFADESPEQREEVLENISYFQLNEEERLRFLEDFSEGTDLTVEQIENLQDAMQPTITPARPDPVVAPDASEFDDVAREEEFKRMTKVLKRILGQRMDVEQNPVDASVYEELNDEQHEWAQDAKFIMSSFLDDVEDATNVQSVQDGGYEAEAEIDYDAYSELEIEYAQDVAEPEVTTIMNDYKFELDQFYGQVTNWDELEDLVSERFEIDRAEVDRLGAVEIHRVVGDAVALEVLVDHGYADEGEHETILDVRLPSGGTAGGDYEAQGIGPEGRRIGEPPTPTEAILNSTAWDFVTNDVIDQTTIADIESHFGYLPREDTGFDEGEVTRNPNFHAFIGREEGEIVAVLSAKVHPNGTYENKASRVEAMIANGAHRQLGLSEEEARELIGAPMVSLNYLAAKRGGAGFGVEMILQGLKLAADNNAGIMGSAVDKAAPLYDKMGARWFDRSGPTEGGASLFTPQDIQDAVRWLEESGIDLDTATGADVDELLEAASLIRRVNFLATLDLDPNDEPTGFFTRLDQDDWENNAHELADAWIGWLTKLEAGEFDEQPVERHGEGHEGQEGREGQRGGSKPGYQHAGAQSGDGKSGEDRMRELGEGQTGEAIDFEQDSKAADSHLKENYLDFAKSLTPAEVKTVTDYKGLTFYPVNSFLRGEIDTLPDWDSDEAAGHVADLDEVFRKEGAVLSEDMVLYRGMDLEDQFERNFDQLEGEVFEFDGFTSTSASTKVPLAFAGPSEPTEVPAFLGGEPKVIGVEEGVLVKIVAPAGTKAIAADVINRTRFSTTSEQEMLLDRGYEFRVIEVGQHESGIRSMTVEVIPESSANSPGNMAMAQQATVMAEQIAAELEESEMITRVIGPLRRVVVVRQEEEQEVDTDRRNYWIWEKGDITLLDREDHEKMGRSRDRQAQKFSQSKPQPEPEENQEQEEEKQNAVERALAGLADIVGNLIQRQSEPAPPPVVNVEVNPIIEVNPEIKFPEHEEVMVVERDQEGFISTIRKRFVRPGEVRPGPNQQGFFDSIGHMVRAGLGLGPKDES